MNITNSKSADIEEILKKDYIEADRIILFLLFLHWIAATFLVSHTYGTYLYGFISGGIIVVINSVLYYYYRGTAITRYSMAVSLMLFSLIFIQQQLGRIEIHFHVFIGIAFLTLYKDMFPIILAAITTIVHHVLFYYLQLNEFMFLDTPIVIFNYGCSFDIVILHAVFVIIEALMLSYIVRRQHMQSISIIEADRNLNILHHELEIENIKNKELAKESQQFSSALDQSCIISKTDTRGVITYVNQKFCDISGYKKEELIGRSHNIIRHPDMPSELFESMWKTIHSKKTFNGIIKNLNKNNESYYVDSTIMPILNVNNDIVEYLAVRYDVTDLINARDNALLAQKAKDQFLATMSHELRTPLNSIIGFTQLANKKSKDSEVNKFLNISLESSNTLLELINNILDISKMKSGKFSISMFPFNPYENINNLLHTFEPSFKSKNIFIKNNIDKTLDKNFLGDWQRISQIIANLVSNAIKFTHRNGIIKIEAKSEDNLLICSVKDTGIGLSKEAQKRIFNAFEQADSTTTREYGGTGLGLSISQELAIMMNGNLSVESSVGVGSTFTLIIPLDDFIENRESDMKQDLTKEKTDIKLVGHVLVAEDNKTNQMLIKLMLEEIGLKCDIANDGLEALKMYGEKSYDLVLMDENMPHMSGIEAMNAIHEKYDNNVPIVALTANTMKGDRERFLNAGMNDFIGKPIDEKELLRILKKYLNNK